MRTREEQSKSMAIAIEGIDPPNRTITRFVFNELAEAERRAEERVRAEIARDSERLDWLEREFILMALIKGPTPVALDQKLDAVFTQTGGISFRQAIDAAREAG